MASPLLKSSERHYQLVAECNHLLLRLPRNDYILHDMGLRIVVRGQEKPKGNSSYENKTIKIQGLSTDPIDFWDDYKLEKFYSKLSLILMSIYETEAMHSKERYRLD
ncbi:MAG TPA: hypothetical protein VLE21_02935 [Candidatus Nitrosocosmicus sp.]|nr:hypothetical protein [Candidatus Nitrosocosmicus sp.]